MSSSASLLFKRWRVALGVQGLAGGSMAVLSGVALAMAWGLHHERMANEQRTSQLAVDARAVPQQPSKTAETISLPSSSQQTTILREMELSGQKLGLTWSKVDYNHQALSENNLASMDIKGVMRGPYPALRDFLAEVLSTHPSTALRSLILTRESAESIDVEARISLSVFLSDGWLSSASTAP